MNSQVVPTAQPHDSNNGHGTRRRTPGNWVLLGIFGIAFLVFLDAPVLAWAWSERPFLGFMVEQTLVVPGVSGQDWVAREIGIAYPQRVIQIGSEPTNTLDEFDAAIESLSVGDYVEVRTISPQGIQRTYPLHWSWPPPAPCCADHGFSAVFGYRIGDLAYITDVKAVPATRGHRLTGVRVLVMSALWWRPHPTHQSIAEAVEAAAEIGAERTYLTHLSHETGPADLLARIPAGIEPAYDGLTVEIGP